MLRKAFVMLAVIALMVVTVLFLPPARPVGAV
jgi:hypothetical protein